MADGLDSRVATAGWADAALALEPELEAVQRQRTNLWLWVFLATTNLIDVLATGRAFSFGIAELNPIVDQLHLQFGMSGITLLKAGFLTLLYWLLPHIRTWTQALFALACTVYLGLTVTHLWYLVPLLWN